MVDFLQIKTRSSKRGALEIYPKFIVKKSNDLMIRGSDFYAIWDEDKGLWTTEEQDAIQIIDRELDKYIEANQISLDGSVSVLYLWDSDSGSIDRWHKYCQKQMPDSYHMLDEKLVFSNDAPKKRDYASKRLSYPLEECDIGAYDRLVSTLYSPSERAKIEWAIGSIITGDSKKIQKFLVLYGAGGTGKSTVLNIMEKLFEGYWAAIDSKALGQAMNTFALESFRSNPLVGIQHEGDLSRIEDNTRLNALVSHDEMTVNEKFKSTYSTSFKTFLILASNKPVRITDAKSGIIRRLIDVKPSGMLVPKKEYDQLVKEIQFELGGIACHCRDVYLSNPGRYDDYIPVSMMDATNDFYNFVVENYHVFQKENGTTLNVAWEMYNRFVEDARVQYPMSKKNFKEELKNYFWTFEDRGTLGDDNGRFRNVYKGFKVEKFYEKNDVEVPGEDVNDVAPVKLIDFDIQESSIFDEIAKDYPAQLAGIETGKPVKKWANVDTVLKDIDTSQLHYVKLPENHIVIDFDIKDKDGNKSYELNLEAASKWPPTYAELSKSGAGIHLHYIYNGDVSRLKPIYDDDIEVKVFTGNASLRRQLSKCNNLPIATINSGLPLKKEKSKVIGSDVIQSEKHLRTMIKKALAKEIHPNTKPSMDFIKKIMDEAAESGITYDVTDMRSAITQFALMSSHQSDTCLEMIDDMQFRSEDASDPIDAKEDIIVFYDVEVFPNLFLINYKVMGDGNPVIRLINPKPQDIEELLRFKLIGFNCRRYDNHMLYACLMGYSNIEIYRLSQRIINGDRNAFFREAYNLSYTDVYDFASAGNKQSLKKFEIQLGIHHQELGLRWDKPVPKDLWQKVAEYCDNDVIATEVTFNYLKGDWTARQILAELTGKTVNDSTNSLTTALIFGNEKDTKGQLKWRDLSQPVHDLNKEEIAFLKKVFPEMMSKPHGEAKSQLPYFPGYKFENGKSTYKWFSDANDDKRRQKVKEGGLAFGQPGVWEMVALLDVTSMHPHSALAEIVFGVKFTERFYELVYGRVDIKHEEWDEISNIFDGKLLPFVEKVKKGELTSTELANALKTAINSVYGLTFAGFDNQFKDPRNKDNIVAKRGALFMVDLKEAVEARGFTVAHIKTDSIKIPDATPEIIKFVMDFGARYGYYFEHEATYERMCLLNDAVYIARYAKPEDCEKLYGYVPGDNKKHPYQWTATGTEFQVPYVFKTLFTHEPIEFKDLCETFSVQSAIYLDMNEDKPDVSDLELVKELRARDPEKKITKKEALLLEETELLTDEALNDRIAEGHDYHFIGKVGLFCPIQEGHGGGELLREVLDPKTKEPTGKFAAVGGTKDYRWLETETVTTLHKEDDIDMSFYERLADDAKKDILIFRDFEWFISDDPYIPPEYDTNGAPIYPEEVPFK